jgi:DNA-binding cell septation regulator SpoVG
VTLIQGKDNVFVAMPSYRTKQKDKDGRTVYKDICFPVTKEFREKLYGEMIEDCKKENATIKSKDISNYKFSLKY